MDGTGQPWEYTLSWAHRIAGGPDDDVFVLSNWEFGPLNVFDTVLTNAAAAVPYPIFDPFTTCSTTSAPTNLVTTPLSNRFQLSWDPIPFSVACQVKGSRISPPGPNPTVNIVGAEPTSTLVPYAVAGAGTTWNWQVRCACSISPISATPFSTFGNFTVPTLRTAAAI